MGNIIQSIPEAKLLLASLRSVGYTEETAIADIVDNCISAKAKHIDIIFETEKMRILILDDGIGMTAQALIENMRIGSSDPSKQRDDTDLGRFGMGMKTAAFSLGKRLRKSMWIHPTQDRAISVREAARLQTFPDSFVFCGSKDKQYQQVGNAVPPIMAKSIAEKLAQILEKNLAGRERNG